MSHVLLATRGTGGDLSPFLEMGRVLKARGHAVTLLTHCAYAGPARQVGIEFAALDTPAEFAAFIADGHLLNRLPDIAEFFRRHILPQVRSEYEQIVARCVPGETVLVARYMADIAVRFAAEKLSLPWVRVFTAPGQPVAVTYLADLCSAALAPEINQIRADLGLPPIRDWRAWLRHPRQSIGLWPEWFGQPDPTWTPGVTPVGFLWYEGAPFLNGAASPIPPALAQFLADNPRPVLISGGTGKFVGPRFFAAAVGACRELGMPAVIISRDQELLPDPLPPNVAWFETWFDRFPSLSGLMARMAVILHHGGMGTLGQALAAGVPQLLLAAGADRPDNAERLQRLGVAEFLRPPQWEVAHVAAALRNLTSPFPNGAPALAARCAEVAGWLRQAEAAADCGSAVRRGAVCCGLIETIFASGDAADSESSGGKASAAPRAAWAVSAQPDDLTDRLSALSSEKRALLAARLKKQN